MATKNTKAKQPKSKEPKPLLSRLEKPFNTGEVVTHPTHGRGKITCVGSDFPGKPLLDVLLDSGTELGSCDASEWSPVEKVADKFRHGDRVEHPIHGTGHFDTYLREEAGACAVHFEVYELQEAVEENELTLLKAADPVQVKPKTVKFETLPLLTFFEDGKNLRYLKVGNSTAIHVHIIMLTDASGPEFDLEVGKQGKQRFKKNAQVVPVTETK